MPAPSPLLKASAFLARWTLALLLFAWVLLGVGWGILHLAIVPRIGEFRPRLEAAASAALGITVRIEAVAAYSTGLLPAFELTNTSLHDAQGREALRLPRILVSLSPRALLAMKFDQVYVDSPTLAIRRAADGRLFVAGFEVGHGSADEAVLDQIFSQPELAVRHGAVVWTDDMRGLPPLALRDVDLVLRNKGRHHDFRFDATPPSDWGDRFGLVARFEQPFLSMRNGRWRTWNGQVHADFGRIDVSQLQRHADLPVQVQQGRGALRSWVEVRRGVATAGTVDMALADVVLGLDPALQPLALAQVSGRLTGSYAPGAWSFATRDLAFDTADGLRWPGGNLRMAQTAAEGARPARGELSADRLDLAALGQIASRLPLEPQLHALLDRHAPGGLMDTLRAQWEGPAAQPARYEVQGRVRQLSVRAMAAPRPPTPDARAAVGTPGVAGAAMDFSLNERGGKASLQIQDGSMDFPGVFEEPRVPMARFAGDLSWQIDGDKLRVDLSNGRFGNADAEGEMRLHWQTSDPSRSRGGRRFPGVLDLQGSLSRADGTRVFRYLPLVLHQGVRDYVRDAVQGGVGSSVKFRVKGDLHDMPFADPKLGEFSIAATIRNGSFSYVPRSTQAPGTLPWPALTQLAGELVFERSSMRVSGARGVLAGAPGVQILRADAAIADLLHQPQVVVNAEARGPLAEMLTAVNGSPLAAMTGQALSGATASGTADLRLRLGVPLDKPSNSSVAGSVALAGNDMQLAAETPRLSRVRGTVNFTESGFSLNGMQARALGGELRVDGGTLPAAAAGVAAAPAAASSAGAGGPARSLSFRAQGTASAEGLRQAREWAPVARLAQYATGSASYAATFGLRDGVPELALSSSLVGMALNLPAPLAKAAESALPLRLESSLLRETAAAGAGTAARGRPLDQLVLELGRAASVTYVRDISGPQPQVLRGAIAVGLGADESAPLPTEGVMANIQVPALDLDAWSELASHFTPGGVAALGPASAEASEAARAMRAYLPTSLALRARTLEAGGRKLHNLVAGGTRDGLTWRANLDADELAGLVEYRQSTGAGPGRVYARLARLTLEQSSARDVETLLDDQPSAIPALDVVVDDLQLRGKRLGRLEIDAVNRQAGTREASVREWRLNRFDVTTPEAVFRASGNWTALNAQAGAAAPPRAETRRTVMNFELDILNAGELLGRFGMRDVVRRGKGTMEGQISWLGSPLSLDYATLGGAFSVNVENGQFLKADPGLAKLLGVLSLQSLPRRLTLDFRDVFSEGFAFDFFRGDVKIFQGIASANNLQMKGVNAAVLMDGQADLLRETQDIKVVVVPEINAGTASLIASAINPAIGLGSFLAQLFLRRPLIEAATQEFHVDGTWVDPRITRVDRRAGARRPEAAPATGP